MTDALEIPELNSETNRYNTIFDSAMTLQKRWWHNVKLTLAAMRHAAFLLVVSIVVIAPACFFWTSLISNIYKIEAPQEILSHVAIASAALNSGDMIIDNVGLGFWLVIGVIGFLLIWKLFPFRVSGNLRAESFAGEGLTEIMAKSQSGALSGGHLGSANILQKE